jgi:C4-dicarboxylate-specific signal transduction histidine kinase
MVATRLQKLLDKKAQIDAQIKAVAARTRTQDRKNDTRRKVIVGALALHHMEKNPDSGFTKTLMAVLDEYVTRAAERRLLGLKPLAEAPANDRPRSGKLKDEFPG